MSYYKEACKLAKSNIEFTRMLVLSSISNQTDIGYSYEEWCEMAMAYGLYEYKEEYEEFSNKLIYYSERLDPKELDKFWREMTDLTGVDIVTGKLRDD